MLPRFTIVQILLAMVVVGCGLAVARLPQGGWFDFLMVAVGLILASSMLRRLVLLLKARNQLAAVDRPSAMLLCLLLFITTGAILLGVLLRYISAAGWLASGDKSFYLNFLNEIPTLSMMLTLLGCFVAIGLGQPGWPVRRPTPYRARIFTTLAMLGLLAVLVAFWCNFLYLWFLVYISLCHVDASLSYGSLTPPPVNFARDATYFFRIASLGLPLCLAHLALIAGFVTKWQVPRWRAILSAALLTLVLLEGAFVIWLAGPGLRAISPHFAETLTSPAWDSSLIVVAMVSLFATWMAFRLTAIRPETTASLAHPLPTTLPAKRYIHECLMGAFLVGIVATINIIQRIVAFFSQHKFAPIWEIAMYHLTFPDALIVIATALGGFAIAWQRRRPAPHSQIIAQVDVAQFATVQFAVAAVVFLGGPIIAAFTFGLILFGFGMTS